MYCVCDARSEDFVAQRVVKPQKSVGTGKRT